MKKNNYICYILPLFVGLYFILPVYSLEPPEVPRRPGLKELAKKLNNKKHNDKSRFIKKLFKRQKSELEDDSYHGQ